MQRRPRWERPKPTLPLPWLPIQRAIHHDRPRELMQGVVACKLTAFSLLAVLGLRSPLQLLQMLQMLWWELLWKAIWLLVVALPLWRNGQMDDRTAEITAQCPLVVIIPFVIPWRCGLANYLSKGGERWC